MLDKLMKCMGGDGVWPFLSKEIESEPRRKKALKDILFYSVLCVSILFVLSFFCSWGWTYYSAKELMKAQSDYFYSNGINALNLMKEVESGSESFEVCSNQHLKYINKQLYKSTYFFSVSYVVDGNIVCNNKGKYNYVVPANPSITMDNGLKIWGYWPSGTHYGLNHLAASWGSYIIQFNPFSILNTLNVNMKWKPLVSIRHGDHYLGFTKPLPSADLAVQYKKYIFADQYVVEMGVSYSHFNSVWKRHWFYFLPICFLMSLICFVFIFFRIQKQYSIDNLIAHGLRNDEFHVFYQPIVDLENESIIGAEALIRWDFDGQLINTDYFISQAELLCKIGDITRFVLTTAAKDMQIFRPYFQGFSISINIAPQDLQDGWLLVFLQELEVQYGLRPAEVKLELTERGMTGDKDMLAQLNALRLAGYRLAIDDFGTGYSSLSYLHALPLDLLKIDRSFVATLCSDGIGRNITPDIISMAHKLDLTIIAEGVETIEQHQALRELGVQWGQGWLFGKAERIIDFLCKHTSEK